MMACAVECARFECLMGVSRVFRWYGLCVEVVCSCGVSSVLTWCALCGLCVQAMCALAALRFSWIAATAPRECVQLVGETVAYKRVRTEQPDADSAT